ncbi:MAG: exodeoxyribonuclease III [Gammaproteobacteria bacterium]|nr:exodeoxyribonuclease III [Gammaproteobacteria bacterium]
MKSFRIATWNVNSLRVRLPQVLQWLADTKPDVLALQELKMPDEDFPHAAFDDIGYTAAVNGQKTWNGVALLTRETSQDSIKKLSEFTDARLIAATIQNIRIINVYIPNGESVASEKFKYKLNWLKHFKEFVAAEKAKFEKIIILGDFNIAPTAMDMHDPIQGEGDTLFNPFVREAFQSLIELDFQDCFRLHHSEEKNYTWWDYRLNAFKRNLGWRIDHILASSKLASACEKCVIDKTPRGWERPSDHAPVIASFKT